MTVVSLAGNLDLIGATRLLAILPRLAGQGSRVVVCDVSRLSAPEPDHLLTVFPAAQRRAGAWPHCAIHLAAPGCDLETALLRGRIHRFMPVHASLAAALLAARDEVAVTRRDLELLPDLTSSRLARELVRRIWPDARHERDAIDDGLLVVTELTSNAVRHTGRPFTLSVALSRRQLMVGVTDLSRQQPVLRPINDAAVGGRGMQLVAGISREWGVRWVHERGKTVWAALDRRPGSRRCAGRDVVQALTSVSRQLIPARSALVANGPLRAVGRRAAV